MKSELPQTFYLPEGGCCCGALRRVLRGGVQDAAAQTSAAHTFRVFVRGVDTGIEEVTVLESADGWTLRGSGKLRAPVNLAMDYWEARYDRAWKPIELTINLTESAKRWTVHTTFNGTIASSDITQEGQVQRRTSTVAADTVVLPNLIFGAYEALAARLATEKVGSQLQVFIAPQDALSALDSQRDGRNHQDAGAHDCGAALDAAHGRRRLRQTRDGRMDRRQPPACASTFRRRCSPCCATTSRACRRVSSPWRGRMTRKSRFPRTASASPRRFPDPSRQPSRRRRPGESRLRCGFRPLCSCRAPGRPIATSSSPAFRSSPSWPTRSPMPAISSCATTSAARARAADARSRRRSKSSRSTRAPSWPI